MNKPNPYDLTTISAISNPLPHTANPHNTQTHQFQARYYLLEHDGLTNLKVWTPELDPMTWNQRPTEEWAQEHLENLGPDTLRELTNLPPTGNYQTLITATIHGWMNHTPDGDEWDEEITIENIQTTPIPDQYLNWLYPPLQPDPTPEQTTQPQ